MTMIGQLRGRSIAVGSGKGGVGKSTTALNLAVFYSKLGLRVGLFDLDPLSNIATILDVDESRLKRIRDEYANPDSRFDRYVYPVFPGLDLVFPKPKLRRGDSAKLRDLIFGRFCNDLVTRYSVLIYDLPAGITAEENLAFLPYIRNLLVVTNAEPTSHVSAGGYIKAALEIAGDLHVYFWHNKFSLVQDSGFNPTHVLDNYNRYVDEELRIDPLTVQRLKDIAYIPHDEALDLLNNSLSLEGSAQVKMLEVCGMLRRKIVADSSTGTNLDANTLNLGKYLLTQRTDLSNARQLAAEIEAYCVQFSRNSGTAVIGKYLARKKTAAFTDTVRRQLETYIAKLSRDPRLVLSLRALSVLSASLAAVKDSTGLFSLPRSPQLNQRVHIEVLALLKALSADRRLDAFARNLGGMLLFYFALFKLMPAKAVQKVMLDFIPKRKNAQGRVVRDKNRQIRYLVTRDEEYHRKYFALIRALFPLVLRQVGALAGSFGLTSLVLRSRDGEPNKNAYLKLLTNFVHDSVHAGLGVFIGFKFNAASEAIKQGAKTLLAETGIATNQESRSA